MSGDTIPITVDTARMFVDAWAWSTDPKQAPDHLGPVATHNARMLDELRAGLAALDTRPEGAA